jgi:hypothetical membrane protein
LDDIQTSRLTRAHWAVAAAVAFAIGAMVRYPGGTPLDRASTGYSLSRNFLSDLGMTAAYNGERNRLGAALFIVSLLLLVLGLGATVWEFTRLASRSPAARRWARAGAAAGLLTSMAFTGVAVTPENRVMALHVGFTLLAWRIIPAAALFMTIASALATDIPRRVTLTWAGLTAALALYVAMLELGPNVSTASGLTAQVLAQKIIAVCVVTGLSYVSLRTTRLFGMTAI